MKKLILLLAFVGFSANAQTIPKDIVFDHFYNFVASDKGERYFSVEKDTIMTVNDSLKTINNLYKMVMDSQKKIQELSYSVEKSVDYFNSLPEYLKPSKLSVIYLEAIKKQGYSMSKKTKP